MRLLCRRNRIAVLTISLMLWGCFWLAPSHAESKKVDMKFLQEAYNGNLPEVKAMLEKGADPNMSAPNGKTALMAACHSGHRKVAELLLEKGADPNLQSPAGKTALMVAIEAKRLGMAELLLKQGAKVDAKEKDGATALFFAVMGGDKKTVEMLLDHGAYPSVEIKKKERATPRGPLQ